MNIPKILKRFFPLLPVVVVLILMNSSLVAQETMKNEPCRPLAPEDTSSTPPEIRAIPYCSPKEPVNCEVANFYLDNAAFRARALDDTYLIVIARLGDGEMSRQLNISRMRIVQNFLSNWRGVKRVVMAEGERVKGYGRLEFYVGGKLLFKLPVRRNKNIGLLECNAP